MYKVSHRILRNKDCALPEQKWRWGCYFGIDNKDDWLEQLVSPSWPRDKVAIKQVNGNSYHIVKTASRSLDYLLSAPCLCLRWLFFTGLRYSITQPIFFLCHRELISCHWDLWSVPWAYNSCLWSWPVSSFLSVINKSDFSCGSRTVAATNYWSAFMTLGFFWPTSQVDDE